MDNVKVYLYAAPETLTCRYRLCVWVPKARANGVFGSAGLSHRFK